MNTNRSLASRRWITALSVSIVAWTLAGSLARATAPATATISDLTRVDELKTLFNQDRGKTRVVLLLSPT